MTSAHRSAGRSTIGTVGATSTTRRRLLQSAFGVLGAAALGACGATGGDAADPRAPGDAAVAPAFVPYTGVAPDLEGDPENHVPDAFFSYPEEPPSFIDGPVGNGGGVRIMTQGAGIAVPLDQNSRWQQLNSALDVELSFEVTMPNEYDSKQAVVIASGELPDIMQLRAMAQFPKVLDSEFADLSEHLGGDAVKDYPALAAIPSLAWDSVTVNGRIFGIPQSRPPVGPICTIRGDLLDEMGAAVEVSDGEDFLDLCRAVTDPSRNRFAIGSDPAQWTLAYIMEMMSAPTRDHPWAEREGDFTCWYETEQMPDALEVVRGMWEEGLFHPESVTGQGATMWRAGATVIYFQNFPGWGNFTKQSPEFELEVLAPQRWDGGGQAAKMMAEGAYADFMAFRKAEPERITELLRISNWLAAPFGTKEFLLANYGVAGDDYTLEGTDPVATDEAQGRTIPTNYLGSARNVPLYVPGHRDVTRRQHEFLSAVMPTGIPDPTVGLYSETAQTRGRTEDRNMWALQGDIIQGRRPVSAWEPAVTKWRQAVGDRIREEYGEAHAQS